MTTKQEVKKLKITAVNIRSVLTDKTKELGKLGDKKKILTRKQRLQAERAAAEKKIEQAGGNKGPVASVLGNVGGMVMSIKDRIMNFFGYLLMGFVVDKLPQIISSLSSAYDRIAPFVKVVWKVISTIAKALMGFGGWVSQLWKPSEAETNVAQLETIKKDLEGEVDKIEEPKEEEDGGGEETKEGEEDATPIDFSQVDKFEKGGGEGLGQTETKQEGEDEALVDATGTTDDPADAQQEGVENPLENLIAIDPEKIAKTGADGEKKEDVTKEDDKVEQVIDANVNNILNKVHKVTGDLKVQNGGNNLNTVIVPVEVIATTGNNDGGSGGGTETRPEPEVSNSLVLD
tara:strand:+ start:2532 stop:3569 length:1038 start_codon:yes stop_codon:yes gene_type:complete